MGRISTYRLNKTFGLYRLKNEAHKLANKIWNYGNKAKRAEMYRWIRENSPKKHIAHMTGDELRDLIKKLTLYKVNKIQSVIKKVNNNKLCIQCLSPKNTCLCKPNRRR